MRKLTIWLGLMAALIAAADAQTTSATLKQSSDGWTVYDSRLDVTWLADADLPAKQTFGVPNINKNGSMDYATAVRWVDAMNGAGYLGHSNWQLPTTPQRDNSCEVTGRHGESFGYHCSRSALGSLYYLSLGLHEPATAVQMPATGAGPFKDFQPYLYWSKSASPDAGLGFVSFSFNTGFQGTNVSRNHLYVLPLVKHRLSGTPPASADGQTVYDAHANVTWLADANLAAKQAFGIEGIDPDGSMDHATAVRWIDALNKAEGSRGYLGQTDWDLPETGPRDPTCSLKGTTGFDCTGSPLGELFYGQLHLRRGESVVATPDIPVGPFHNLQPYLYWSCAAPSVQSACRAEGPNEGFEWNFSFGNGFQGTNLLGNPLYVMVYYPGSGAGTPLRRPQ